MLDKKIYEYMLAKFNSENTQEILFKGNFVFVRVNDTMQIMSASTYNANDLINTPFVGVAQGTSVETPFSESNNRSAFTKRLLFYFDIRNEEKVLDALDELRDYFLANRQHTIDGFKTVWRVSRASFISNEATGGTVFATYYMDFFGDAVETGFYFDGATHKMCVDGGTLQSIIVSDVSISYATNMNPSNVITSESNTSNVPVSDGLSITMNIYYDSTTLLETLYKHITGKYSRETKYDYQVVFDSISQDYELYIQSGSVVYQNGLIAMLNITFVEA